MTGSSQLHTIWSFLCILIALFYLFRLVGGRAWMSHFDPENEVGHGLMALGMMLMLAPAGFLPSDFIRWNIVLFALAVLWWTSRLLARKPLFALLSGKYGGHSTIQSDAIHVLMHGGMCYMFLLLSSMALSMTQPATYANCLFFVSFALLTFYYVREGYKDLQVSERDWLQLGANIAHVLMSAMMSWMFIEMLSMTLNMGRL